MTTQRPGLTISREDLERAAGRELTDEEVAALSACAADLLDEYVLRSALRRISPDAWCRWCGLGLEQSLLHKDVWWDVEEGYDSCGEGAARRLHQPRTEQQ